MESIVDPEESTSQHGDNHLRQMVLAADLATHQEHQLSNYQAFLKYWKGLAWALFISLSLVLAGFDLTVCGNLVAVPAFKQRYGKQYNSPEGTITYIVPVPWQVGITLGIVAAQMVGAFLGGPAADRFGRKLPIYVCLVGNTAFTFLEMFATTLGMLLSGALLNGVCYGFYFVLAPTYAAEVVPYHLRNISTAFSNMAIIVGQLLGQGAVTASLARDDDFSYRIPFALQWFWVVILFIGLWPCPESPWHWVNKRRLDKAEGVLIKLAVANSIDDIANIIAQMEKTSRLEQQHKKSTSYVDCFRGTDFRRTEISTVPFFIQVMSCNLFLSVITYFLQLAGLSTTGAFYMGIGTYALGFITNVISYPFMTIIGRRTVFLWGSLIITILFFIVGCLDLAPNYLEKNVYPWTQGILLVLTNGVYNLTIAPASWVIMSETASTRLRARTVSIAVAVQVVLSIPIVVGLPYQINPTEANWRGKNGFFFGGIALVGFIWGFFRLPELKGRTYEEADILFQKRIPTQEFAKYQLEIGAGIELELETTREPQLQESMKTKE